MLTRPVAQRRARQLFDLVAGFVYSQVLLACVRLDLFGELSKGPQTLSDLAHRLGLPYESARRLLAAATSLKLVERRSQGRYGLGVLGAAMVGNTAVAAMVEHHSALYADLADPVALLRGETDPASEANKCGGTPTGNGARLASYWPYAGAQTPGSLAPEQVSAYSALMSASQPLVAHEILDAYPLGGHSCLLDIGGGEGTFLMQVAQRAPHLKLCLFDLPAVADRARARFAMSGLADKAEAFGGDFLKDPLPEGADIATLVRVVHDHDDARVLTLLRAVYAALKPGGTLLLAEPMAATSGAEPMGDAYFGFYLLAMGRGQPRAPGELAEFLKNAGFQRVRLLRSRMPLQTRVLLAKKST